MNKKVEIPSPWDLDLSEKESVEKKASHKISPPVTTDSNSSTTFFDFDSVEQRRGIKMLVYGLPGSGKTRFGLTAEDPIKVIDTENAVRVFKGADFLEGKKIQGINVFEYDVDKVEVDSIKILKNIEKELYKLSKDKEVKTIVLDSVSSLWSYIQDWLRWEVIRTGGRINKKNVPADRRDWAKANSKHDGIMMALISSDANVILTAHRQYEYDSQGNRTGYMKPATQKKVPYWVDVIVKIWYEKKRNKYFGEIEKCRYPKEGVVGTKIENPTFKKIKEIVLGEEK